MTRALNISVRTPKAKVRLEIEGESLKALSQREAVSMRREIEREFLRRGWKIISTSFGLACLALMLTGCATKGGGPCWSWEKNTDQKEERAAKMYQKTNQIHQLNQGPPMPPGYVANVSPQMIGPPPPAKHLRLVWTDPQPSTDHVFLIYSAPNLTEQFQLAGISASNSWSFDSTNDHQFFCVQTSNTLTGSVSDWATK